MTKNHITIKIGATDISRVNFPFLIAEVGLAHQGDLKLAHRYIDEMSDSGIQAIKFQTHIAEAESTSKEPWRIKWGKAGQTRLDYWRQTAFDLKEWRELKEHAEEKRLIFMSSPFSKESAEILMDLGIEAWKIASGEITNHLLLEYIASTGLPVLLSTGMSPWVEIDEAVQLLESKNSPLVVMQCTSMYPTPPDKVGLNLIPDMLRRYNCPIGYSNHANTLTAILSAALYGASVIEMHVHIESEVPNPDQVVSFSPSEIKALVEELKWIHSMKQNDLDKDAMSSELSSMREIFMKSVVSNLALKKGHILRKGDLTLKKPGTGIAPHRLLELVGKTLARDVKENQFLEDQDFICAHS